MGFRQDYAPLHHGVIERERLRRCFRRADALRTGAGEGLHGLTADKGRAGDVGLTPYARGREGRLAGGRLFG